MKIIHTGDWHLGKNLEGESRLEEQEKFLIDFVNICEEKQADLVIIAGDVYDTSNPPAKAEKLFYDTLKKLSRNGKTLSLVIAGNHDNPERISAASPLAMDHGIIMVGSQKNVIPVGNYGNHKIVSSGEGFVEIEINNEKAVVLTVPFPSEKRLEEIIYQDISDDEQRLKNYSDKIREIFDNLSKNFREDTINLVVSHLFAMGSLEDGSERSIQLGGSYIVDASCFPDKAQYTALGHVHKPQKVPGTQGKVRYSGSPIHYNKNELSYQKQINYIEVKVGEEAEIQEISLPVYKKIEVWKASSIENAIDICKAHQEEESWVYLEIQTDRYIREDEIKLMRSLKTDILEIRPIIAHIEKENTKDIAEQSFREQFIEFYKSSRNNLEPEEKTLNLLLELVSQEDQDEAN